MKYQRDEPIIEDRRKRLLVFISAGKGSGELPLTALLVPCRRGLGRADVMSTTGYSVCAQIPNKKTVIIQNLRYLYSFLADLVRILANPLLSAIRVSYNLDLQIAFKW
jgi:hypothetical protein